MTKELEAKIKKDALDRCTPALNKLEKELWKAGFIAGATTYADEELREAAEEILHLHLCEQEGIASGQPTRKQWLKAIDKLLSILYPPSKKNDEHQNK